MAFWCSWEHADHHGRKGRFESCVCRMKTRCRACGFEMWTLGEDAAFMVHVCRRCDSAAVGAGLRWGPPRLPDTTDGRFQAPFGDLR